MKSDDEYMGIALARAHESAARGEVPVGAVLVDDSGVVIASAGNDTVSAHDPVGHAEIRVLRKAARVRENYRLPGTTMYVTLEPCAMCAAALVHSRVARLVFGARDPKTGAVVSLYHIGSDGLLNHSFSITGGVREEECGSLLREFFQMRR
ncbi:MAG: tRNA adenosine(34) deaminase TadA [Desulfobulbaceae bacterium]